MIRNVKMLSALLVLAISASLARAQTAPPTPAATPATRPAVSPPSGPGPTMGPMSMPPASRPSPDEWVFTLNGKKYTEGDVEKTFEMFSPPGRGNDEMAMRMLQAQHQMVVERTIDNALLQAEADKLKLTVTEADVDAQGEQMVSAFLKARGMTREQLAEQQKATGMTLEDSLKAMRPRLRMQTLMEKLSKEMFKDITVTEEEIKQAHERNTSYGAQVRASHILLSSQNPRKGMTPEEKEAAHKKAEEVVVKAKAPGADFAALANEYSVDKAANAKGGDLGFFGAKGPMDPVFTAAAFALKPGEVSDIVETRFGFHIIKLTETRPAKTLEEVREEIVENLKNNERQKKMQSWLQETRAKADIQYAPGKAPATRPAMMPPPRPASRPTTGPARPAPMPLAPRPATAPAKAVVPPPAVGSK